MTRRVAWGGLLVAAAAILGCTANGKESPKPGPGESAGKPPVAVEVVAAEARDLSLGVEVVGTLEPKFEALTKAELAGAVTEVHVTQWVRVSRGQPLAKIDTRELDAALGRARAAVEAARAAEGSAKAGLLEARVAADRADRELTRLQSLKESGLATQQSLDEGLTAQRAAQARIAAAQAQIAAAVAQIAASQDDVRQLEARSAKAVIRSPLDGVVAERSVNVGDLPGDKVLFRIVDNRLLNLTVSVPSREMGSVRVGQRLSFSTDAFPGETFEGRVMFVNPAVDPADRSVKVVAEVRNVPERLKGGLFVKGRLFTGDRKNVLQVPRQALLSWEVASARADLFVVQGALARRRTVRTGAVAGDLVEAVSGLTPGELVVVRGAFNLKEGDPVRTVETAPGAAAEGGR